MKLADVELAGFRLADVSADWVVSVAHRRGTRWGRAKRKRKRSEEEEKRRRRRGRRKVGREVSA